MSEDFVRSVLREHAEVDMPRRKDPWPAIRERVHSGDRAMGVSPGPLLITAPREVIRAPGGRSLRVNTAMAMVALVALATLVIAFVAGNGFQALSGQPEESALLPAGKVRHMIYTGTHTVEGGAQNETTTTIEQHREEFWLVEGKSHPLMRTLVTVPSTITTWLDDNAYYEYDPAQGNQVRKYPYDPKYLAADVPDPEIITKTLRMPNARLVGDDILDGRPVVVITVSNSNAPNETPPTEVELLYTTTTFTYWIDRKTNQVLQISIVVMPPASSTPRLVERTVNKLVLNELIERSELPADFFEFKLPPGTTLVEEPASSTPTP